VRCKRQMLNSRNLKKLQRILEEVIARTLSLRN
jgi:hypothetical protein